MLFEWDKKKNETNFKKHGIKFEEAIRIISARKANKKERKLYHEHFKKKG